MRRGILLTLALALGGGGLALVDRPPDVPVPDGRAVGSAADSAERLGVPLAGVARTPLPAPRGPEPAAGRSPAREAGPAVFVDGFVLDADGLPAPHAWVALGRLAGRCDAAGRFRLALPEELGAASDLVAWLPGREPGVLRGIGARLCGARGSIGPLRVDLGAPLPSWPGRLVDEQGRALKGWRVVSRTIPEPGAAAALGRPAGELAAGRVSARTDDAGRFELRVVPGRHRIRVSRGAVHREFERTAGEALVLVVPRG